MKSLEEKDVDSIAQALAVLNFMNEQKMKNPYIPMFEGNRDAEIVASLLKSIKEHLFKSNEEFLKYCEVCLVVANVIMQRDRLSLDEEGNLIGKKL